MPSSRAVSAYRLAIRATKIAFPGDSRMIVGAHQAIRAGIAEVNDTPIADRVAHLEEVAKFLKRNVAQGVANETGRYTLNLHKDIELGDNESIKQESKVNLGSLAGKKVTKCCSSKD